MSLLIVTIVLVAYLLGSIPFGYLAGRLRGLDIRNFGSGNIGATNVLRVMGKPWGFSIFILDALKGFVAVRLALLLVLRNPEASRYAEILGILAAAICVIGHSFPVWLGFKGGKGVATSAGSIFGVMPIAAITIFLVWLIVFSITRYVSLASIVGALSLPVTVAILLWAHWLQTPVLLYFSFAMALLVVWRHRSNISRLLSGTEPRFKRR